MVNPLETLFPGLSGRAYQVTSPATLRYNCIAWAAGDEQQWWWPDEDGEDFWPAGVERVATLEAFQMAFATLGFEPGAEPTLEMEFEKIALYATEAGIPKHAARQLPNGRWTSKLGRLEDIEHGILDLEGVAYGRVKVVMKRPLKGAASSTGNGP